MYTEETRGECRRHTDGVFPVRFTRPMRCFCALLCVLNHILRAWCGRPNNCGESKLHYCNKRQNLMVCVCVLRLRYSRMAFINVNQAHFIITHVCVCVCGAARTNDADTLANAERVTCVKCVCVCNVVCVVPRGRLAVDIHALHTPLGVPSVSKPTADTAEKGVGRSRAAQHHHTRRNGGGAAGECIAEGGDDDNTARARRRSCVACDG